MVPSSCSNSETRLGTLYADAVGMWRTYKWKIHNGKIEIILFFCRKVSFVTGFHSQYRGVGQVI